MYIDDENPPQIYSEYFNIARISFRCRKKSPKKYYSYKIYTFLWENLNSEHTFISSKVDETKVSSEFKFFY